MDPFMPLRIKRVELKNRIVMPPVASEQSGPDGAIEPDPLWVVKAGKRLGRQAGPGASE